MTVDIFFLKNRSKHHEAPQKHKQPSSSSKSPQKISKGIKTTLLFTGFNVTTIMIQAPKIKFGAF